MSNKNFPAEAKFILSKYFLLFWHYCSFLSFHPSALCCTHLPFVWSSWVQMMLRCKASSRAAAEPNRREWGRKEERKWQTGTRGILGPAKNSTEKRRGEWWRVCRHNDEGNMGRLFLDVLRMKCFAVRTGKKKKAFPAECTFPLVK